MGYNINTTTYSLKEQTLLDNRNTSVLVEIFEIPSFSSYSFSGTTSFYWALDNNVEFKKGKIIKKKKFYNNKIIKPKKVLNNRKFIRQKRIPCY